VMIPLVRETRHYPWYDVLHLTFYQLEVYLSDIDRGMRSNKTAREMSVDVSKFLRYACGPRCPSPDWTRLTDCDQLVELCREAEESQSGPRGPTI
jgi:hypothetical protein